MLYIFLGIGFIFCIQSIKIGESLKSFLDQKMTLKFWHPRYFKKAAAGGFSDLYMHQLKYRISLTHIGCLRSYHEAKQLHSKETLRISP